MSALIVAQKLVCGFGARALHQPIDFEIGAGTCTVLLGANGAGKSTLLRTLLGLHAPLAGRVLLENRNVHEIPAAQKAAFLAYVPQKSSIPEGLTVEALLRLGAYRDGRLAANLDAVLAQVSAKDWRGRLVTELSGGEQQRVMIARALMQGARGLVLDEPTAHLDISQSQQICTLLSEICAAGSSVILSSHDPNDALRLNSAVLAFFQTGRVEHIAAGAINSPQLEQAYGVNFSEISVQGLTRFVADERLRS